MWKKREKEMLPKARVPGKSCKIVDRGNEYSRAVPLITVIQRMCVRECLQLLLLNNRQQPSSWLQLPVGINKWWRWSFSQGKSCGFSYIFVELDLTFQFEMDPDPVPNPDPTGRSQLESRNCEINFFAIYIFQNPPYINKKNFLKWSLFTLCN